MSVKLVIGNKNYSSWSLRAWLMLAKLRIPFEEILVPLSVSGSQQALHRYSPSGRVPVYQEDGLVIWDTLAIAEYLAEAHPQLWPQDKVQRALARSIAAEMHAGFVALRQQMPMNCRASGRRVPMTPALERDIQRVQDIWCSCRQNLPEEHKSEPWLFGSFTIADAMYAPVVFRFNTYGVSGSPTVVRYMEAVLADPHVATWYEAACRETAVIEEEEVGV